LSFDLLLMNNAGVQPGSGVFGPAENWEKVIGVNPWGVIHGVQAFVQGMIARGRPGLVINTGSKQGITTPPGDPAYNVSKAGLKAYGGCQGIVARIMLLLNAQMKKANPRVGPKSLTLLFVERTLESLVPYPCTQRRR
jgi:NADP-dependent 3-hydroxy acid dehydrogenase YdfG